VLGRPSKPTWGRRPVILTPVEELPDDFDAAIEAFDADDDSTPFPPLRVIDGEAR
jgi:hypothetical protein